MHGYFINTELYDKVALISNPNAFKDEREREIRRRIEKERESRIRTSGAVQKPKIKVNKNLVEKLSQKRGDSMVNKVIEDDRFKEMFEDEDFQVDEESYDYKQLNPVKSTKETDEGAAKRIRALTAAEESDEERIAMREGRNKDSDDENEDESDSDGEEEEEEEENDSEELDEQTKRKIQKQIASLERRKREKEASEKFMAQLSVSNSVSNGKDKNNMEKKVTFGDQVKKLDREEFAKKNDTSVLHRNHRGEAELTFIPKKAERKPKVKKHSDSDDSDEESKRDNGRTKQRYTGRRSASKNTFRGM